MFYRGDKEISRKASNGAWHVAGCTRCLHCNTTSQPRCCAFLFLIVFGWRSALLPGRRRRPLAS